MSRSVTVSVSVSYVAVPITVFTGRFSMSIIEIESYPFASYTACVSFEYALLGVSSPLNMIVSLIRSTFVVIFAVTIYV